MKDAHEKALQETRVGAAMIQSAVRFAVGCDCDRGGRRRRCRAGEVIHGLPCIGCSWPGEVSVAQHQYDDGQGCAKRKIKHLSAPNESIGQRVIPHDRDS
ncbi:hypothetical protein NLM31_07265 [Bradyrhizobium sp. CCGUVB4N]|uniref:hypothetical protein n=1 Tax=Bradyrhizobium sp. CCGUVB4N TaxID=2949631 RepID=UPI0020B34955|nr:hypothetical protein [Bradyrhizobium sp. CCGUVB4N]MCP3380209.1 hypothetical protein [Bradyrhizobium sp. CCGUVB4N]